MAGYGSHHSYVVEFEKCRGDMGNRAEIQVQGYLGSHLFGHGHGVVSHSRRPCNQLRAGFITVARGWWLKVGET